MGLCASCCDCLASDVTPAGSRGPHIKRKLPLLCDLEHAFKDAAGGDNVLTLEELTVRWKDIAGSKAGRLTGDDAFIIEETAKEAFQCMDLDSSGTVGVHEFLVYHMGGMETRGSLRDLRHKMKEDFRCNPWKLRQLVDRFMAWDKNGDGLISKDELERHLTDLADITHANTEEEAKDSDGPTREKSVEIAQKLKLELVDMDTDGDGKIDLWEIIAWALGRRKSPVELLLYDISRGACRHLAPLLVGRKDLEVFHSSVLVYGSEYWYGGKVFRSDPPVSDQFGQPLRTSPVLQLECSEIKPELMVVRMGYTFVTHEEFMDFLNDPIIPSYSGMDKYDVLTHSCNHFSDELLKFLLGKGVPDHVLEFQRKMLTPKVKAMRPFLNKYLGGMSGYGGDSSLLEDTVLAPHTATANPNHVLGEGDAVHVEMPDHDDDGIAVAVIVREGGGTCDVKYFDPVESKVCVKTDVPMAAIKGRINRDG